MLFGLQLSGQKVQRHILGWMLLAILLPFYAPLINSNFAAVQPDHDHVYFGKPNPDHDHTLAHKGAKGHKHGAENEDDIAFLPSLDAASGTAVLLILSLLLIPFAISLTLFFLFRERLLGVNLLVTPPPIPPPRLLFAQ